MPATIPVSVRMSPSERELVENAAEFAKTNFSEYVRRKIVEAAEMDLMERRIVTIPAKDWERFEAWKDSPPRDIPKLRDLLSSRRVWED